MKPESRLSKRLAEKLDLDVWHRVENSAQAGTPDVYYQHKGAVGWIELKHLRGYPARPVTPIRFHRYTAEQANTSWEFGYHGAASWVLVQVGVDHWLFSWHFARELRLGQPLFWWRQHFSGFWKGRLDYEQLSGILTYSGMPVGESEFD